MAEAAPEALLLRLDGFEGPLDLLLDLARTQKLDLAGISILSLVDQYLAVIAGASRIRLELAADWLVMAAWLAWLRSRLLLPADAEAAEEGEAAASTLAARLADLAAMRAAAAWLEARAVLGRDVFARGQAEDLTEIDRSGLSVDVAGLLRAYLAARRRALGTRRYRAPDAAPWPMHEALARMSALLGSMPDWSVLESFLPEDVRPAERRAAYVSTLLAGLELARSGAARLRQDSAFGPILLQAAAHG